MLYVVLLIARQYKRIMCYLIFFNIPLQLLSSSKTSYLTLIYESRHTPRVSRATPGHGQSTTYLTNLTSTVFYNNISRSKTLSDALVLSKQDQRRVFSNREPFLIFALLTMHYGISTFPTGYVSTAPSTYF